MRLLMCSRRTLLSGEVVTFATGFEPSDSVFGGPYRATGPFEVSASRDAVIVHRAEVQADDECTALVAALRLAGAANRALAPTWRGGAPSMYPDRPTECVEPPNVF